MKKLLQLAIAAVIFSGLLGCANPAPSNAPNSAQNSASPASNANVAASMKMVAYHFEKKLQPYEGALRSLNAADGNIHAEWDSKKCDSFRQEVIDLAICIHRGYNDPVKTINVRRTCDSVTKTFAVGGEKYDQYRTNKIGDPQFTEGIE